MDPPVSPHPRTGNMFLLWPERFALFVGSPHHKEISSLLCVQGLLPSPAPPSPYILGKVARGFCLVSHILNRAG
jgi:hypothetical protein